ncbi:MAG: hypothetical protein U5L00_08990 [Desulfovermiculus sp.]|nr:hypothetical protein [Desulfovermiculus sp.]
MRSYFVHNKKQDTDYIVISGKTALTVTPKVLSEFLYAADLSTWPTEFEPDEPHSFGQIVAVLDGDHLQVMDSDLWEERRRSLEW